MKTVIVYNFGSTQRAFSVASRVALEAKRYCPDVTVLDIEAFTYVHQGLPPSWWARIWGYKVFPGRFDDLLAENGVKFEALRLDRQKTLQPVLPAGVESELSDAISSDLFTYLRTDKLEDYPLFARFTARQIWKKTSPLFWQLVTYFRLVEATTVYVPNGRVAHQRLATLAAKAAGCRIMFYEIGRAVPNSAYIGSCQIHDRHCTQTEAKEVSKVLEEKEVKAVADKWLSDRTTFQSAINPFSETWSDSAETFPRQYSKSGEKRAIFFTSSADEFSSYGLDWATHGWKDQFDAFRAIAKVLRKHNVSMAIRVHPNLVNKNRKYYKRERDGVRLLKSDFPELEVFSPTTPVNSYSLVEESDFIFVGRSTLGLEASLMGKCVWTTTPARYDNVADVRKIHSPGDLSDKILAPWKVDISGLKNLLHTG